MPVDQKGLETLTRLMALEYVVADLSSKIQMISIAFGATPDQVEAEFRKGQEMLSRVTIPDIDPALSDLFADELSHRIMSIRQMAKEMTDEKLAAKTSG